jgi:hypothetical protein
MIIPVKLVTESILASVVFVVMMVKMVLVVVPALTGIIASRNPVSAFGSCRSYMKE